MPGDFVTALLAEVMLGKSPGGTVLYDVRASWAVPRTIAAAGGTALINRVGHAFIKHRMREEHAIFAGEVSAHYYFRDFTQADTGVVPFLLMLELISKRGEKLSEILRPFRESFFITGEINTPVADVPGKLREIEERYAAEGGRVSHLDGVSVDFDSWHFNVRPSNTEPLLRLNLEALSRGGDDRASRRARHPDPELIGVDDPLELGRLTDRRPPFRYSALTRVWFSDTDAQGVVYYGRYLPYFDHARTEYHRHLGSLRIEGAEFVMRASNVEYLAPARFDDLLECFVRVSRIGRTSVTYDVAAYRLPDDDADGDRHPDGRPDRHRDPSPGAGARARGGEGAGVRRL